jgi:predicted nucleic acid-binding protein
LSIPKIRRGAPAIPFDRFRGFAPGLRNRAAGWSGQALRLPLKLGEARAVELLVSFQVLSEIEAVFRRKEAQLLPTLVVLLDRSRVINAPAAPQDLFESCCELLPHPGDARILADAWHNQVDFLVTLDKAHFLDVLALAEQTPFPIGTPGDCLAWLRANLIKTEDS